MNISDILDRPGSTKRVRVEAAVAGLSLPLAHVEDDGPLGLDLRLDAILEGIHVSGTVSGAMTIECRRCLALVASPFAVDVSEVFAYERVMIPEEGYVVRGQEVDLEPMLRDAVVLAMPLHPLCRADCAGLCAVCGQDLNVKDCGHRRDRPDLRWEPLRGLRETMTDGGD